MIDNFIKCKNDVLKTLLYFDVFNYPLTIDEIASFSQFSLDEIKQSLNELTKDKFIFFKTNFYSILDDNELIERRVKGNEQAAKINNKAKKVSRLISQFPYVRGVFISGSLSKGYFAHDDDIDFFIITKPNRLWFARTTLIAYKKVFLLNSKKYFCVNYFMSDDALEIAQKNRFTATEFVTLMAMNGKGVYNKILNHNNWILDIFPNFNQDKGGDIIKPKLTKRFLEFIFNGFIGDFLEKKFMEITQKHQQKKFKLLNKKEFEIAFKGDKNTSKHHPSNHQIVVLEKLNKRIEEFNIKHNFNISLES